MGILNKQFINTTPEQLLLQISDVRKKLRSKKLSPSEKLSLANYLGNLYAAIICLGYDVNFDIKECFGGTKNYNKFIRKIDYYSCKMVDNFVFNKEFHKDNLFNIITETEEEKCMLKDIDDIDVNFSRSDFFELFNQFMKSIGKDKLFDYMYKNHHIYSTKVGYDKGNAGFTVFNPIDSIPDVFISNFKYDLRSMNTLAHELGHCDDLLSFDGDIESFNKYFYMSFYNECISKLYELLLNNFLSSSCIDKDIVDSKRIDFHLTNFEFLLEAYILSLLSSSYILEGKYLDQNTNEIVEMIGKNFTDEDYIKFFIDNMINFDIAEIYNYAYGGIVSLFLYDDVLKNGFDSKLMNSFMKERINLFNPDVYNDLGFSSDRYVRLYKKEVSDLIK